METHTRHQAHQVARRQKQEVVDPFALRWCEHIAEARIDKVCVCGTDLLMNSS